MNKKQNALNEIKTKIFSKKKQKKNRPSEVRTHDPQIQSLICCQLHHGTNRSIIDENEK
jgi:hypothetical protein